MRLCTRPALYALCSTLFLSSCMYRVGSLYPVKSVRLRIVNSNLERRTHEFNLTTAISRELLANGIRVNTPGARHELVGELVDFDLLSPVVDAQDVPIVGEVAIKLRMKMVDRTTGRTVWEDTHLERAKFSNARGESLDTAQRESFDRLARWVTMKMESDW